MSEPRSGRRFERRVSSSLSAVETASRQLRAFLAEAGAVEAAFGGELVARELLNNAVTHGNRLDPAKSALLYVLVGRAWITIRVTDEGEGFDWRRVMRRPLEGDEATCGRGLSIGKTYCGRVRFSLGGRRVTVRLERPGKRR